MTTVTTDINRSAVRPHAIRPLATPLPHDAYDPVALRVLHETISTSGMVLPLVVFTGDVIVDGRSRLAALRTAGATEFPVLELRGGKPPTLTPMQAFAIRQALTRSPVAGVTYPVPDAQAPDEELARLVAFAVDQTMPVEVRRLAADAVRAVDETGWERAVREFDAELDVLGGVIASRYVTLAALPHDQMFRMSAHFESLTADEREHEVEVMLAFGTGV